MFTDPVKNARTLGLHENAIVADLGAGTGFYSVALGHLVPRGKVYAIDIARDFLATIKNKAHDAKLKNVEIIWGNVEEPGGTKLRDNLADAIIASNILLQIEHKHRFIDEIKRILKPGGKALLVDWHLEHSSILQFKNAVTKKKARAMFEEGGFKHDRDIDAGGHHYGMILVKL